MQVERPSTILNYCKTFVDLMEHEAEDRKRTFRRSDRARIKPNIVDVPFVDLVEHEAEDRRRTFRRSGRA